MDKEAIAARPLAIQALILLTLWLSGFPLTNLLPRFLLGGVLLNLGAMMVSDFADVTPILKRQRS